MVQRLQLAFSVMVLLCAGAAGAAAQSVALAAKPAKIAPAAATTEPSFRTADGRPDLQGYWTNNTVTPLERPKDLADKAFFTPEEAAAYAKRQLSKPEPTGKGTYADVHYNMAQFGLEKSQTKVATSIRTSLITDPPDGRIPPMTPEAVERNAALAAKNEGHEFDSAENRPLRERCIAWGIEGPPMMPVSYNSNSTDRARRGLRGYFAGNDSRSAHDSHRWQCASCSERAAVEGRLARPLGGRHAGGGYHEFHRPDGVPRLERESARGGALPARGCGTRSCINSPWTILHTWTRPWSTETFLTKSEGPIFEYACHEGNYGMANNLSGARAEEKKEGRRREMIKLVAACVMAAAGLPAWAHHSFAAEFDATKPVKLEGTVTKMEWINPHSWIHIDVKNPDGTVTNWMIEGGSPNALLRRGFTKHSLEPGTQIVVEGYQAKDGANRANGRDLTFPDGRKLFIGSNPDEKTPDK